MQLAITIIRYFINYTVLSTRVMLSNALAVGVVILHSADLGTYIFYNHVLYTMFEDFILLVVLRNHYQPTL
jgi:hypothetical protein